MENIISEEQMYDVFASACPSRAAFDRIFSKWNILILSGLSGGALRFGEIHRRVDGISERMLSRNLKTLEEEGLVLRTDHKERPPRVEYSLTAGGRAIADIGSKLIDGLYQHMVRNSTRG